MSCAYALAAPPVVERVPDDAMVVIGVGAPLSMQKNLAALAQASNSPTPVPSVEDLAAMGGMGNAVDPTKGFAIVLFAPTPDELKAMSAKAKAAGDDPEAVMDAMSSPDRMVSLLAVKNYNEFVTGLGGKPGAGGSADAVTLPSGDGGFSKDIGGGYVVVGASKARVEGFTGKPGASPIGKRLGVPGDKLADGADLFTIVNMEQVRPLVPMIAEEAKAVARERAEEMGGNEQVEKQAEAMTWILEIVARDAQAVIGSIRFSTSGLAADMNVNLTEGSALGKAFAGGGSAGGLLAKLPSMPYLFAGGIDTSNANVKQLWKDITSRTGMPGGEQMLQATLANIDAADGQAAIVGFPMGGIMAGLLTQTVSYVKAKDPVAYQASAKSAMLAMNGQKQEGMTVNVTYKDAGAKVGETPVDVWDFKFDAGEDDQAAMAAQGMAFIFGPQGAPGGYVAKTDAGVYTTFAKSSDLLSKSLEAGAGKADALGGEATLQQTAGLLPKDRIAEAYIGTKSILDLALPFVGMMGVQVPMEKIPEKIAPIGLGISSDAGQARFSFFVPTDVLKTGFAIAESVMDQMDEGGEDGAGEPEGEQPGKRDRTGQPRF